MTCVADALFLCGSRALSENLERSGDRWSVYQ